MSKKEIKKEETKEQVKQAPATQLVNLDRAKIVLSELNPRKTFDKVAIEELAQSIREQGLLQPITVRPIELGKYEVVCGARRFLATGTLNWETVPTIIREMTNEEALDAMITENLQRKDVNPLEEADAFRLLQEQGKTVADLAVKFGKSERYIRDRISLCELMPGLASALNDDRLTITAALKLSHLSISQQSEFYDEYFDDSSDTTKRCIGLDAVHDFLDCMSTSLAGQPFFENADDDEMREDYWNDRAFPKCASCPHNSASQMSLFPEFESKKYCMNPECFKKKQNAWQDWYLDTWFPNLTPKGMTPGNGDRALICINSPYDKDKAKRLKEIYERYENNLEFVDEKNYTRVYYDSNQLDCIKCLDLYSLVYNQVRWVSFIKKETSGKLECATSRYKILDSISKLEINKNEKKAKILQPLFCNNYNAENPDWLTDELSTMVIAIFLVKGMSWATCKDENIIENKDIVVSLQKWFEKHSFKELIAKATVDFAINARNDIRSALLEYLMRKLDPEQTESALAPELDEFDKKLEKLKVKLAELDAQK